MLSFKSKGVYKVREKKVFDVGRCDIERTWWEKDMFYPEVEIDGKIYKTLCIEQFAVEHQTGQPIAIMVDEDWE